MKTIITSVTLIIISIFSIQSLKAQKADLDYRGTTWGHHYYLGSSQITKQAFMSEMRSNNVRAAKIFRTGKRFTVIGKVVSSAGIFCLGFDIGARLVDKGKGSNAMIFAGGGALIGGSLISLWGENKMKKALNLYKDNSLSLNINTTNNGVGLFFNF